MAYLSMNSPIGSITLFEDDGAIVALEWGKGDSSNLQRKTKNVLSFLETLEDNDDVQYVYANLEVVNSHSSKDSSA